MSTVYSLVCWGGRTGKTVTLNIASPCVITSTNHGLRDGTRLVFSTTGALPTGITAGTTYYAKPTAANTFNLYTDAALTSIVNTSGTQSGTHTAKSVLMGEYFSAHSGRWGDAGNERCYGGIVSCISGRAGASPLNEEIWELGEAFDDIYGSPQFLTTPAATITIVSKINGTRTEAYHQGVLGVGFVVAYSATNQPALTTSGYNQHCDGFTVHATSTTGSANGLFVNKAGCSAKRMIVRSSSSGGVGVAVGSLVVVEGCLIFGWSQGTIISQYVYGCTFASNIFTKNSGYGIYTTSGTVTQIYGYFYNNISVGNGVNWIAMSPQVEGANANAGLSTDTIWVKSGTTISMTTADFVDWDNNDFRPLSAASPQVDSGVAFYNYLPFDLEDSERPNYMDGGAEYLDVGCYEFDHGYGNHPASTTVTFSGVNAGSEIRVYDASGNELAGVESSTANPELTWVLSTGDVRIVVVHLDYKIKDFQYTPVSGAVSLPVQQEADSWYSNPA